MSVATKHRYRVGQTVQFTPRARTPVERQVRAEQDVDPRGGYTVTRLLPATGFDLQYRIKAGSGLERVVTEDELSPGFLAAPR